MTDPSVGIHVKENAVPKSVHTPAQIPLYWQHKVHDDLLCDEALDVIEKIPYGEPVSWCNWMAVTRKHDGTPRRTVDKFYERETFASASPFQSAHRISDAWNGFHSVTCANRSIHYSVWTMAIPDNFTKVCWFW